MWGRVDVGIGGMWAGAGLGKARPLIIWCGVKEGDPTSPVPLLLPPELCERRRGGTNCWGRKICVRLR